MKKHLKSDKKTIMSIIITIAIFIIYNEQIKSSTGNIFQLIFISISCLIIMYLILRKIFNLYGENKKYLILLMLLFYYIINIKNNILNLDFISKMIVFFLTFFVSLNKRSYDLSKIKDHKLIFTIISIINAFLFVGHNLFLQSDTFNITIKNISFFILFYIYIISFEIYFINLITNVKLIKKQKCSKKDFIIIFLIMAIIWSVAALGFYPANVSSDGVDQIMQALGIWPLQNSHPIIMALIMRFLYHIIKSTFFVILVQILFASLTFTIIFYEAIRKGINKKIIYIIAFIIAVMPNNYMMMTTLVKDVPYCVLILLISYYIYKLIEDNKYFFKNKIKFLLFPIALVICSLYRHNGKGVLLLTLFSLIIIIIKYKEKRIWILIIESLVVYFTLNNVIFPSLYITKENEQVISGFNLPVKRTVARLNSQDLYVSNKSNEIISRMISPEILGKYFNKYNNDTYYAAEVDEYVDKNKNKKNVLLKDLGIVYIECLKKYPYQTIKERTDATNLLWNVSMPVDGYNHRYVDGIWYPYASIGDVDIDVNKVNSNNKEAYLPNNIITKCFRFFRDYIMGYQIFDWILWRTGIYWIIIILCSYVLFIRKKEYLLILCPMIGNTLTLLASLSWQLYRYVYYVPLVAIGYVLFTTVIANEK